MKRALWPSGVEAASVGRQDATDCALGRSRDAPQLTAHSLHRTQALDAMHSSFVLSFLLFFSPFPPPIPKYQIVDDREEMLTL